MTTRDFTANVISASKVVPDGNFKDSKASGVWDINEALDLIKGGNWPNVANINPAAFVDGVFQTHLYTGSSGSKTITNNIDFSNKGGLLWIKNREATQSHYLFDTERGAGKGLRTNGSFAEYDYGSSSGFNHQFTSTGFSFNTSDGAVNNGDDFVSWAFRKQPKFFDIVTYTGTGSAQAIAHNLGSVPGMIITKATGIAYNWGVFHRSRGNTKCLTLDDTGAEQTGSEFWNNTDPTSTHFTVKNANQTGDSGQAYVAYLFAHNDDDGGFGEPGDQDIIKCGSVTADGSGNFTESLGFEPQFILFKAANQAEGWEIFDGMRNLTAVRFYNTGIEADSSAAEGTGSKNLQINADGFASTGGVSANIIYTYMAIRRGGMQTPTTASSVFGLQDYTSGGDGPVTGIVTDFSIIRDRDADAANYAATRLLGNSYLTPMLPNAEVSSNGAIHDRMDGAWNTSFAGYMIWGWQRARGYFDVVPYTGTGSDRTVNHNLGVAPEMIWAKRRNNNGDWVVYHAGVGNDKGSKLNETDAFGSEDYWNSTDPTSSVFTLGGGVNDNNVPYVAYLFATAAGVSKVGTFTQSGATNVSCSFTGDTPALIILKRTDSTGNWYILDSVRGIVAGNDPHTYINESNPEISNVDLVDPYSGGFATTSSLTNGDYIFYAIAAVS